MKQTYPILEFDPAPNAILNPHHVQESKRIPEKGVMCFFQDVLRKLAADGTLVEVNFMSSEIGRNPVYTLEYEGQKLFVFHPGVGAPLAGAFFDEAIQMGGRKFIACGGVGALVPEIVAGHAVILSSAVRDEGTSYHYLPPSREAFASPEATAALEQVVQKRGVPYITGKAWTTDAIYRETESKRMLRIEEGCQVVEMEASAFFAIAQFRGVTMGELVYGGDLVVPEGWDERGWMQRTDVRQMLFWLAVEAAAAL